MRIQEFRGFAGVRLQAEVRGQEDAPPVLLIHDAGQTRGDWAGVAEALAQSGRQVVSLDLRGHGGSEWPSDGRYAFDVFADDVRAVLAQMPARPLILGAGLGGWLASVVVGEDGAHLASGLVLVGVPAGANGARLPVAPHFDPSIIAGLALAGLETRVAAAASRVVAPILMVDEAGDGERKINLASAELAACEVTVPLAGDALDSFSAALVDFLERRLPLAPPEYREGRDARTFRDALGCFATGVTIVTAMDAEGKPIGLTANSFTSVSLDPPLLLVCIANNAGSAPVLEGADRFAVNVLQIGQQPTSNRFAGKGEDRFAATPWAVGEFGTPVLTGSLASFECERHAVHEGGDHFILVGRVLKASFEPQRDPLLYFRGKYRRLHFA